MSIQKYGSQTRLLENQLYTVKFALAGEEKTFSFTSRYSPLYSTVKVIRNDFPEMFAKIKDDTIHFLIWQTSLVAQEIASEDNFTDGVPSFAVKQYVRYKVEHDMVRNILIQVSTQAGAEEKQLGEFAVNREVRTPEIEAILKSLKAELAKWEGMLGNVITNLGAIRGGQTFPYPLNDRVTF